MRNQTTKQLNTNGEIQCHKLSPDRYKCNVDVVTIRFLVRFILIVFMCVYICFCVINYLRVYFDGFGVRRVFWSFCGQG